MLSADDIAIGICHGLRGTNFFFLWFSLTNPTRNRLLVNVITRNRHAEFISASLVWMLKQVQHDAK